MALLLSLTVHLPLVLAMEAWGSPGVAPEEEEERIPLALTLLDVEPTLAELDVDETAEELDELGELKDTGDKAGEEELEPENLASEADALPEELLSPDKSLDLEQAPAPELDPLPQDEEEDPGKLIHVRTEKEVDEGEPDQDTKHIARTNLRAPTETRSPSSAAEDGEYAPDNTGAIGQAGNRSPDTTVAPDQEAARRGEKEAELRAPVEQATAQRREAAIGEEGLGQAGGAKARGPSEGGDREAGKAGEDSTGAGARRPSEKSVGGPSPARLGSTESPPPAPDGWLPMAVRVDPSVGRAPPTLAPSEIETQERNPELEILRARGEEAPETIGDLGSQDHSAEVPEELEMDDAPAVTELESEGDEAPQTSPGWGGDQVLKAKTQASVAGNLVEEGAPSSSPPEVLEQELEVAEQTQVAARLHEHAAYMDELDSAVDRAWREQTPTEVKAMGLQGTVTVRIELDHKGRVVSKKVVRQSGYSELDSLALAAVPPRLPKPPKGLADPTWSYEINLRMNDRWASTP